MNIVSKQRRHHLREGKPERNCDRFDNPYDAYLAWVRETQDSEAYPVEWGELEEDAGTDPFDQMQELWIHWFKDDQNREFVDWLFESV